MGTEHPGRLNPLDNTNPSSANEIQHKTKKAFEPQEKGELLPKDRVIITNETQETGSLQSQPTAKFEGMNKYLESLRQAQELERLEKLLENQPGVDTTVQKEEIPKSGKFDKLA